MIKAGIIGGAGYTGGELLRLLIHHPQVEIGFVHSKSNAGNPIYKVHADLFGDTNLHFTATLSNDIDVLFLCVGHGEAIKFLSANPIASNVKIIDLSQDFRLKENATFQDRTFVYGLPELNKPSIQKAQNHAKATARRPKAIITSPTKTPTATITSALVSAIPMPQMLTEGLKLV
jgi:N-acetyl-gamma-glutamyl-phosphate reductase